MIRLRTLHGFILWSTLVLFASSLPAQQGGKPGSGGGGGGSTGGSAGGSTGSGGTTGSTGTSGRTSQTPSPTQPGLNPNQGRQRQQPMPFISGVVVMEDGSAVPMGVVIERVCNGRKIKESHVSASGQFSFQIGANTSMVMDASDSGWGGFGVPGSPGAQALGSSSSVSMGASPELAGCELRADLAGYRSSAILLTGSLLMGRVVDVGTIVLHPIAKVRGTTVSMTSLQAPKDAKKALDRANKALRKQKIDEAEKNLKTAVDVYPAYADAWFALGQIYQQRRRTEDARTAYSKARDADSNFVLPYVELARLAAMERKWQEAADLTDHALALDPLDIPDGFFLNSLANFNLKHFDVAERSARKAQRLDSLHRLPVGHLILASILDQRQDYAGEAEQLQAYLKYAPQAANAGQVRARLQELEKTNGVVADKQQEEQKQP
jgi:tetratricopeptide (TPR) repeat protein